MLYFELVFSSEDGRPVEPDRTIEELRAIGRIRRSQADPSRFVYGNPDTGVFFNLWVSALHAVPAAEAAEVAAGMDDGGDGGTDGEETEADHDAGDFAVAPLTITVPLVCPDFFGAEAVEEAVRVGERLGLRLEPVDGAATVDELRGAWQAANRSAAAELDPSEVRRWTRDASAEWLRYGTARAELERELAADGVHVPRLQPALHDGAAKTLCSWTQGEPVLLPRTDLVLVSRERSRRSLFFRRTSLEEGLVAGEVLRRILAPFSEVRESPVPLLIFRRAAAQPQQLAADLEELRLEPVSGAKRTGLVGIVDFDAAACEESRE